jgi:hypothetical protein
MYVRTYIHIHIHIYNVHGSSYMHIHTEAWSLSRGQTSSYKSPATYVHTYINTYIHTYIHLYCIYTNIHAYMHAAGQTSCLAHIALYGRSLNCIWKCIYTHIHHTHNGAELHAYLQIKTHTYMHAHVQMR